MQLSADLIVRLTRLKPHAGRVEHQPSLLPRMAGGLAVGDGLVTGRYFSHGSALLVTRPPREPFEVLDALGLRHNVMSFAEQLRLTPRRIDLPLACYHMSPAGALCGAEIEAQSSDLCGVEARAVACCN